MKHGIRAIIWDMGGVILRTEDWIPRINLAKKFGLTLDGIHELVFNSESGRRASLGEIDEETHWKNLGNELGITGETLQQFRDRFWEGDRLDQDLVNFIRSFKPSYTTALLSNAWTGARKVLTQNKPCIDAFHISIFSCEIGMIKPDPEIYRYLLRLGGVDPDESFFIDDAVENIDAANKLGIHGILFKSADQAIREVTKILNTA
jgi:epoxide hydrolase-like predicted phosphatase